MSSQSDSPPSRPPKSEDGMKKISEAELVPMNTDNALRDAHGLDSDVFIGGGNSLVQKCKATCRFGRRMAVSPECMLVAFDIAFFSFFLVGMIVTAIWNPKFVYDNPLLNYFGINNMCIGIDSNPARYVASPVFLFSVVTFYHAAVLFFKRMWDEDTTEYDAEGNVVGVRDCSKWPRGFVLLLAMLCFFIFSLSPAFPPDNPVGFRLHFFGFFGGVLAYMFLKCSSVLEFFFYISPERRRNGPRRSCMNPIKNYRTLCFVINELIFFVLLCLMVAYLAPLVLRVYSTPDEELWKKATQQNITFPNGPTDAAVWTYASPNVVIVAALLVCPFVALFVAPKSRDFEVEFHYHVIRDQHVKQVCCGHYRLSDDSCCLKPVPCCACGQRSDEVDISKSSIDP